MAIQKEAPNTNVAPPYTLLLSKMKPDSRIKVYTEDTGMFIFFVFHKIPFWERTANIADFAPTPKDINKIIRSHYKIDNIFPLQTIVYLFYFCNKNALILLHIPKTNHKLTSTISTSFSAIILILPPFVKIE